MYMDCYSLGLILLQLVLNISHPKNIPGFKTFYKNYLDNLETDFEIKCNDHSLQYIVDIITKHMITNKPDNKRKISQVSEFFKK